MCFTCFRFLMFDQCHIHSFMAKTNSLMAVNIPEEPRSHSSTGGGQLLLFRPKWKLPQLCFHPVESESESGKSSIFILCIEIEEKNISWICYWHLIQLAKTTWKTAEWWVLLTSLRLGPSGSCTSSPMLVFTRRDMSSLTETQSATVGLKQAGSAALTLRQKSPCKADSRGWYYPW